jgi:hypothetical protein
LEVHACVCSHNRVVGPVSYKMMVVEVIICIERTCVELTPTECCSRVVSDLAVCLGGFGFDLWSRYYLPDWFIVCRPSCYMWR